MRACLTLLIVAGHFTAQVAALHVHADDAHDEHASLPHVHLSWFGDLPDQHADSQHCHDFATTDKSASTVSEPACHDSDAVYVLAITAVGQSANQLRSLPFLTWNLSVVLGDSSPSSCWVVPEFQDSVARSCADTPLYHCALFLQLQILRI